MKKLVRFSSQLTVMVFVLLLAVGAQAEKKGDNLSRNVGFTPSHSCFVPYNIVGGGYATGLHILTDDAYNATFKVDFFCGGDAYAYNIISVPPEGWTGTIDMLLHEGGQNGNISVISPTLIILHSYEDPDRPGVEMPFWVTQFLFSPNGFSHVVFTSKPEQ